MLFRHLFKSKWHIAIVAVMVIVLLNVSIQSLFFNSDKEVVYDFSAPRFICTEQETSCVYLGQFQLANTGNDTLTIVSIDFGVMPKGLNGSLKVLDLNASKPRDFDPTISNADFTEGGVINISNIAPGTYIELNHAGLISLQQKALLVNSSPKVSANAVVIKADPQGTELARILAVLF